jgi:hypothetical protein
VDIPGDSEAILADSVMRAADNFTKVMTDRKGKNDRLSYSKAKADLGTADTRIRRELEEEGDFENYLENYRTRITEELSGISPNVSDPNDRLIFDAEANLSVERGVTAMAELRNRRRQSQAVADVVDMADDYQRQILMLDDNGTRIDRMMTFQEFVKDRVDAGLIDAGWAEGQIKTFVSTTAKAQLKTMPLRTQLALLNASIEANQDPESKDFKPTGSLADFMHQDERVQEALRLEEVIKNLDVEVDAQDAVGVALEMYPGTSSDAFAKQRKQIMRTTQGRVEEKALAILANNEAFEGRNYARRANETMNLFDELSQEQTAFNGQPMPSYTANDFITDHPERWGDLSPGHKELLRKADRLARENKGYSDVSQFFKKVDSSGKEMPSYSQWLKMSPEEMVETDLNELQWRMSFTRDDHRMLMEQQAMAAANKSPPDMRDLQSNSNLVKNVLIHSGVVKPKPGDRPIEEHKTYAEYLLELDQLTYREMVEPGRDGKLGYPSFDTRKALLAEMRMTKAYTGKGGILGYFGRKVYDEDYIGQELEPVMEMTDDQLEEAWLPLRGGPAGYNADEIMVPIKDSPTGDMQSATQSLISIYNSPVEMGGMGMEGKPDRRSLERAWFADYNDLGDEEVRRRLMGQ